MPFTGPNGQEFDDFEDCVETMEGEVDDPEAVCAKWERQSKEQNEEQLQQYSEGDFVEHQDHGPGVVAGVMDESFQWPDPSDENETIEVQHDGHVYIVALLSGGSVPAQASELESIEGLPGDGEEVDSAKKVQEEGTEAEMSAVYEHMDDPDSYAQLIEAKKKFIHERHAAELAAYLEGADDMTLYDMGNMSHDELLNVPTVDDPEVGFSSDPEGWTRKSYLEAWASLGGRWTTCHARMTREFGSRRAKRWCAALKDEVLGTERWRNRF